MTDNSSTARVIIIIHGHDNKNCGLVIIILITIMTIIITFLQLITTIGILRLVSCSMARPTSAIEAYRHGLAEARQGVWGLVTLPPELAALLKDQDILSLYMLLLLCNKQSRIRCLRIRPNAEVLADAQCPSGGSARKPPRALHKQPSTQAVS